MPIDENVGGGKPGIKDLFGVVRKSPALMITLGIGAVVLFYLLLKKGGGTAPSTTPVDSTSLAATTTPGGYYQSGEPSTQPIIFWNPGSSSTPTVQSPAPTSPTPGATIPSMPTGVLQSGPVGKATIPSTDPLIPYGYFSSHKFPTQANNPNANVSSYSYGGTTYQVIPGAGGRIWGDANGQQTLLYAPASYYHQG